MWPTAATTTCTFLEGKDLPFSPRHKANLGLTYRFPIDLTLSGYARYIGKQYSNDANTELNANGEEVFMKESLVFDLKATQRIAVAWGALKAIDLSLSIDNIFNEDYRTFYMYEDPGTVYYAEVTLAF